MACLEPQLVSVRGQPFAVELEPVRQVQLGDGGNVDAPDQVRKVILDAAAGSDILRRREAIALSDKGADGATLGAEGAPFQPVIDALAAIGAIYAGGPVRIEQIGLVELEVLAVLVRDEVGIGIVRAGDQRHDGLDHLREALIVLDERVAQLGRGLREEASRVAVLGVPIGSTAKLSGSTALPSSRRPPGSRRARAHSRGGR